MRMCIGLNIPSFKILCLFAVYNFTPEWRATQTVNDVQHEQQQSSSTVAAVAASTTARQQQLKNIWSTTLRQQLYSNRALMLQSYRADTDTGSGRTNSWFAVYVRNKAGGCRYQALTNNKSVSYQSSNSWKNNFSVIATTYFPTFQTTIRLHIV